MRPIENSDLKQAFAQKTKQGVLAADAGLILLDASLNLVGFDRGASVILNVAHAIPGLWPPKELSDWVRNRDANGSLRRLQMRIGSHLYICRPYYLESLNGHLPKPLIGCHLERSSAQQDAISRMASEHGLTEREQEALRGIALGLSTKEIADRMSISPNTVKAFLRLIMIKIGVESRAAIVAKLFSRLVMATEEEAAEHAAEASLQDGNDTRKPAKRDVSA